MSKLRKNQPGYTLRKDELRRNAWLRKRRRSTKLNRTVIERYPVHSLRLNEVSSLPQEKLTGVRFIHDAVMWVKKQRRNFSESHFQNISIRGVDVTGSDFTRSSFTWVSLNRSNFTEAKLNDVYFNVVRFGDVSFRGADLTGVRFRKCQVVRGKYLDFTDSNITREQAVSLDLERFSRAGELRARQLPFLQRTGRILYRQYQVADIVEKYDIDKDTLRVVMWTSSLEARDNFSYESVEMSDYDPERHHLPQWEVHSLGLPLREQPHT